MRAQIFSGEFALYLFAVVSLFLLLVFYLVKAYSIADKNMGTFLANFRIKKDFYEIYQKFGLSPGILNSSIDIGSLNFSIKIYYQNGTTLENYYPNCSHVISERRFFLDENDNIIVVEVRECVE